MMNFWSLPAASLARSITCTKNVRRGVVPADDDPVRRVFRCELVAAHVAPPAL
jgi:hypothetical protein